MMCMFFNPWIFPVKMHGSVFFFRRSLNTWWFSGGNPMGWNLIVTRALNMLQKNQQISQVPTVSLPSSLVLKMDSS